MAGRTRISGLSFSTAPPADGGSHATTEGSRANDPHPTPRPMYYKSTESKPVAAHGPDGMVILRHGANVRVWRDSDGVARVEVRRGETCLRGTMLSIVADGEVTTLHMMTETRMTVRAR
jgi:hypothetical protein